MGGARTLAASVERLPTEVMIFSPSDFSLSTKLSTSFPFAPSFRALLGPEGLNTTHRHIQVAFMATVSFFLSPILSQQFNIHLFGGENKYRREDLTRRMKHYSLDTDSEYCLVPLLTQNDKSNTHQKTLLRGLETTGCTGTTVIHSTHPLK